MKRIACIIATCTLAFSMNIVSYADTLTPADEIQIVEPIPEEFSTACSNTELIPYFNSSLKDQMEASNPETIITLQEEIPPIYEDLGMFKLTAYCGCLECNYPYFDLRTASGTICQEGRTIAVDPRVIPYGSIVEINLPGEGWHQDIAEDTGGAIKGNRIDVFLNTHQSCFQNKYNSMCEVRILRQ